MALSLPGEEGDLPLDAELRQEGATYWLVDLDSTNGVEVQGKRVKRLKLEDGSRFTIGSTEIAFSRELQ